MWEREVIDGRDGKVIEGKGSKEREKRRREEKGRKEKRGEGKGREEKRKYGKRRKERRIGTRSEGKGGKRKVDIMKRKDSEYWMR